MLHNDISFWNEFLESIKGGFLDKLDLLPSFIGNHSMDKYVELIKNLVAADVKAGATQQSASPTRSRPARSSKNRSNSKAS